MRAVLAIARMPPFRAKVWHEPACATKIVWDDEEATRHFELQGFNALN